MSSKPYLAPDRFAVIRDCADNYGVGDDSADWPNNIIARSAVIYNDGTIARKNAPTAHVVDDAELSRCRELSEEAARLMAGISVGMGSESSAGFSGFFIAAPGAAAKSATLDEALIRSRFGETLFPPVTITVEPFDETTTWWEEVVADGEGSDPSYFAPWRAMSTWFVRRDEFLATAFVRIGDSAELLKLPTAALPRGTEMTGSVLPRLALGLTDKGSLVGLFGYVVQT